ncbi:tetratricopeptide repeat protein [Aquimarina rhabdastrellae]
MQQSFYVCLLCSLGISILFLSPNLYNDFINWDDPAYILHNPLIKDLSFDGIQRLFTTKEVVSTYAPLVLFSWAIDYAIGGLHPFMYHFTNLCIHLIVVSLVYYLVWLISKRIEIAFLTAVLFGVHPMHIEAVAWISARKDLLYTLFFMAGLISYYYYLHKTNLNQKRFYYILCFCCFILSLLSKGTAVIFPLILFTFDYLYKRNDYLKLILDKIPFFMLSAIFFYIAIVGQATGGAMNDRQFISLIDSFAVGFYGYATYLVKVIIPFNLSIYHPYPNALGSTLPWYYYAATIPVLMVFFGTLFYTKKKRLIGFGIAFFFISLIPVIQVLPFGSAVTAERYTYLPYFGLLLLLTYGLSFLLQRFVTLKRSICILIGIYILTLGLRSFFYSKTFKNAATLWSNVISLYPNDFLAYMNRSNHYINNQQYTLALKDLNKGISINSTYFWLYYNRGLTYHKLQQRELALNDYTTAIHYEKSYTSSYLNRGIIYNELNAYAKAIADFNTVIRLEPKNYKAYYNRALNLIALKQYQAAISDLTLLINADFMPVQTRLKRGEVFATIGKTTQALHDFDSVIHLNPKIASVYTQKGILLFDAGLYIEAEKSFDKAVQLDTTQVEAYINLGIIYMNTQRMNEALRAFDTAQQLMPKNHLIYYNRALLFRLMNLPQKALKELDSCLSIVPDFIPAQQDKTQLLIAMQSDD